MPSDRLPKTRHCPICRTEFLPDDSTRLPFCSSRCRLIDLGRWLGEDYRVSGMPADDDPEGWDDES